VPRAATSIACTLPAAARPERLALLESLAADALLEARLGFRTDAEDRVRELIALESQCCAFLDFEIGHDGDVVTVDVRGAPRPPRGRA
jgi:hypothetical protein